MKYNVVNNDGEATSITVFIGSESLVAASDHPNFARIIDEVRKSEPNEQAVRDLFDLSIGVGAKFDRLSERVLVRAGRIYFDGTEVTNGLTEAIVRFYTDGIQDFYPLVLFMEKIATNPNPHSRDHLFRWLTKHQFTICPDGDFLAYKGVDQHSKSISRGEAIVNNEWVNGAVLNAPGTIVEMPRDKVQFDPRVGCSTGLHAGNWRYASSFARGRILRVKINPRDVVSVPTDSNDEKLRVCRYRVLDVVTAEDRSLLYLGDLDRRTQRVEPNKAAAKEAAKKAEPKKPAAAKKAPAAKKAAPPKKVEPKLPRYYEQFQREHFAQMSYNDLRWLAKEWDCWHQNNSPTKPDLIGVLTKEARKRLKTWGK